MMSQLETRFKRETQADAGVMSHMGLFTELEIACRGFICSPCKTKGFCPLHMAVAAAAHKLLMEIVLFSMIAALSLLRGLFCISFLVPLAWQET